jgi:rod shape-determining protein MreD
MAEIADSQRLLMRLVFLVLALAIVFFHLLPLSTRAPVWAPPDLLIALIFAWSLRRPDYVPVLTVALVMLLADLMFQRPPGLLAFLVVAGCEYLRQRAAAMHEASFAGEWLAVGLTLVAITVANRTVLAVLAVEQAQLGLTLMQMLLTIAIYPLVVVFSQSVLAVRKPTPGDTAAMGTRR